MSEAKMQVNLQVNGLIEQMKALGDAAHQVAMANLRASMAYLGYTPAQYDNLYKALVEIQHYYLCDWAPILEDVQMLLGVVPPESIPAIIQFCKSHPEYSVSNYIRMVVRQGRKLNMLNAPPPKPGTIAAYKRNKRHKYLWKI